MTENTNKWGFDTDYDDANEQRRLAIVAEAESMADTAIAQAGSPEQVAQAKADGEIKVAQATAQATVQVAESQRRQAKQVAKAEARAKIAEAESDARCAEAEYLWINGLTRIVRLLVIGTVLVASFYFTPSFWPDVIRSLSALTVRAI